MPEDLTKKQKQEVEKEVKKQLVIVKKTQEFGSEFKKQAATAIIAAFSFLIALEWRDFINLFAEDLAATTPSQDPYLTALYTSIIITILAIIGIALISKWAKVKTE